MKDLVAENKKLKAQLTKAKATAKRQRQLVRDLKQNFWLHFHSGIEQITHDYSLKLNPLPVKISCSYKGRPEVFEIKVTDVICVLTNERMKNIYLKNVVENIEGELRQTKMITVNDNDMTLEKLRATMDSLSYHLIIVSKSSIVNLALYKLNNQILELNFGDYGAEECRQVKLSKKYRESFKERKNMLEGIISLHKKFLDYIS